jgi:hypothetical protein
MLAMAHFDLRFMSLPSRNTLLASRHSMHVRMGRFAADDPQY